MKFHGYQPVDTLPVKVGDKVIIPKGTPVISTNPACRFKVTKRSQTVVVRSLSCGSNAFENYSATNPTILWAGSGSYWMEVDINHVQFEKTAEHDVG